LSPGPGHCRPRVANDDLRVHNLQPRARDRAEGPRRARSCLGKRAFAGLSSLFVLFTLFFRSMCNAISAVVSGARATPSGCTVGRCCIYSQNLLLFCIGRVQIIYKTERGNCLPERILSPEICHYTRGAHSANYRSQMPRTTSIRIFCVRLSSDTRDSGH